MVNLLLQSLAGPRPEMLFTEMSLNGIWCGTLNVISLPCPTHLTFSHPQLSSSTSCLCKRPPGGSGEEDEVDLQTLRVSGHPALFLRPTKENKKRTMGCHHWRKHICIFLSFSSTSPFFFFFFPPLILFLDVTISLSFFSPLATLYMPLPSRATVPCLAGNGGGRVGHSWSGGLPLPCPDSPWSHHHQPAVLKAPGMPVDRSPHPPLPSLLHTHRKTSSFIFTQNKTFSKSTHSPCSFLTIFLDHLLAIIALLMLQCNKYIFYS